MLWVMAEGCVTAIAGYNGQVCSILSMLGKFMYICLLFLFVADS